MRDETAHLHVTRNLVKVSATQDKTKFLETAALPLEAVLEMVLVSEIRDGMTVIAVLLAARRQS